MSYQIPILLHAPHEKNWQSKLAEDCMLQNRCPGIFILL